MAGLTIGSLKVRSVGNVRQATGTITFDDSYPTNGESISASAIGLRNIEQLEVFTAGGYIFEYVASTGKIKAYAAGGQAAHTHDLKIIGGQAAASTDAISAKTLTLGKEAATDITIAGANSASLGGVVATTATVAAASEVANATNLSAVTARFRAIGN